MYEGGIRTPMLVKWPGMIQEGSRTDHVSAFWDLMPTLAEITGAEIPENIDGISFLPALTGKGKQKEHDYLFWEFHEQGGKMAVRMDNWKAVKLNINKSPRGEIELYDLSADISETRNISSSNPEIVRKIEEIMKEAHNPSESFAFEFEK
jgi:arylsulfatase A-like enzyme